MVKNKNFAKKTIIMKNDTFQLIKITSQIKDYDNLKDANGEKIDKNNIGVMFKFVSEDY